MIPATELGPKNINVNTISPGPLLTRAASGIDHFDSLMTLAREKAPEHCLVTPDEIGVAIAMLALLSMRKVTGDIPFIDGSFNIIQHHERLIQTRSARRPSRNVIGGVQPTFRSGATLTTYPA